MGWNKGISKPHLCIGCGETDPSKFYGDLMKSACKECHKKNIIKYQKEQKEKCVAFLGGKCFNCGYCKSISALEFHHKDPKSKDFAISSTKRSWDKLVLELEKCVLLCSNCHREEHDKIREELGIGEVTSP